MFNKRTLLAVVLCICMICSISPFSFAQEVKEEQNEEKIMKLYDENGDKLTENLADVMAELEVKDLVPVIITFKDKDLRSLECSEDILSLKANNKVKYEYDNIPAIAMSLSVEDIKRLKDFSAVERIEYDVEMKACLDTANYWFGTQKARDDFGIDGNKDNNSSYSKNDIVVAVIDTGIDNQHLDLDDGKVIGWKDYVGNQSQPYDDHGHGTHCSSIVAGDGDSNPLYKGVAPGAALVGLKVLDSNGSGSMSDITAAIDWCITNKDVYGIDVISMSLGSSGSSDGTDSSSVAANNAVNAGIAVAIAAGNSGPKKATIGAPGAADKVITVGNMIDVGEDGFGLIYHSSRGPTADGRIKPDIAAPGTRIMAAKANSSNKYVEMTGTSMATPFTAGTIALMRQANPNLTPLQIKNIIKNTAIDWGKPGKDNEYGNGRLDGYEAIKQAGGYTGSNISIPDHMYMSETIAKGKTDIFEFEVDDTNNPIAITMIIPDWSIWLFWPNLDFDIQLLDPNGNVVASQNNSTRQRSIAYEPTQTGIFKIKIKSSKGNGSYYFDLSCDGSNLEIVQDN